MLTPKLRGWNALQENQRGSLVTRPAHVDPTPPESTPCLELTLEEQQCGSFPWIRTTVRSLAVEVWRFKHRDHKIFGGVKAGVRC